MPSQTVTHLADRIAEKLKREPTAFLPSIVELTRIYAASTMTVWKAIHVLESRGLLVCEKGKRTRVLGGCPSQGNEDRVVNGGAHERFYRWFKKQIANGDYSVGATLPKQALFMQTRHIASATITTVFRRLEAEGLIHKKGRRFVVGPKPTETKRCSFTRHANPEMMMMMPTEVAFRDSFINCSFTHRFATAMSGELMSAGFRKSFFPMGDSRKKSIESIQSLQKDVRDFLHHRGADFRGALLIPGFRLWLLDAWAPLLLTTNRPVLYFDSSAIGIEYDRAYFNNSPHFYRFAFDERGAVKLALETLAHAGHRRVAYPIFWGGGIDWVQRRSGYAKEIALILKPQLEIITVMQDETFWKGPKCERSGSIDKRIEESVQAFLEHSPRSKRSVRRTMIEATPSMKSIIDQQATAIIAPSDAIAYEYYVWLRAAGIRVPEEMSLISFDNTPESETFPISTIDPGFARLGYLTAHLLIGDIPTQATECAEIRGICTFVDRGSVAGPRKGSLVY